MVKREQYLRNIRDFYNNFDVIKVIKGVRRAGKSVLLEQIRDELLEKGIPNEKIAEITFESEITRLNIKTPLELIEYVEENTDTSGEFYVLIDEVQILKDFERAINSLRVDHKRKCSIFITGSNSDLLSTELATLLSGRYVSFYVAPFSYSEYLQLTKRENDMKSFSEYMVYGGLPQVALYGSDRSKKTYLSDVFSTIVYRDIATKANVTPSNREKLERFINYIISGTGSIISMTNVANTLSKEGISISRDTLYKYILEIENSYVCNKCEKYNIEGKKILSSNSKYYVTDLGFRNVTLNSERVNFGASIETIVFNQLVSLGYDVYYGVINNNLEIDFVAIKKDDKLNTIKKYIQVAYILSDEKTEEREFRPFKYIKDGYPRYVITTDQFDMSRDGIIHLNILDFLLDIEF